MSLLRRIYKATALKIKYTIIKYKWSIEFNRWSQCFAKLTKKESLDYLTYWRRVDKSVNTKTVRLSKGLSGVYNKYIIPEEFFVMYLEPWLNKRDERFFVANKNMYEFLFKMSGFPKTFLHQIDYDFYDENYNKINNVNDYLKRLSVTYPLIVKPSCDTHGGAGVKKISNYSELEKYISKYKSGNLVVQELIALSKEYNQAFGGHMVSCRVCTYKSFRTGASDVVCIALRFGCNGSMDNVSSGGLFVGVDIENGAFSPFALDLDCRRFDSHPNTGLVFKEQKIINLKQLKNAAIKLSDRNLFARLISYDFILDENNIWRPIEINLRCQTINFTQLFGVPIFGKYSEEVLDKYYSEINVSKYENSDTH